jgi:histidine triad (HIT) family protein
MIPKQHIATLYDVGRARGAARPHAGAGAALMRELGVVNGFRTLINTGARRRQEVSTCTCT